jgi:flagellar basal body-associated protein FliL
MKSTAKKRSQGGTMDIILIILGVAILVFTITMIAVFCVFQAVPDTLVQCFFACCGSEGGFMAVIMVAKKITEGRNEEG